MYRGTTPTLIFNIPFTGENVEEIYITFVQGDKTVLEKTLADVTWEDKTIELKLTQEETLLFEKGSVTIQHRLKFIDGTTLASNLVYTTAEAILKDGVI